MSYKPRKSSPPSDYFEPTTGLQTGDVVTMTAKGKKPKRFVVHIPAKRRAAAKLRKAEK